MDDLSAVFLWEKNGNLLKSLCDADIFDAPQMKGPNKEFGKLSKAKERAKAIAEMKENELATMIGEDAGLMGIYTEKSKANAFEDSFNDDFKPPLKKASGDSFSADDLAAAFLNNTSNKY